VLYNSGISNTVVKLTSQMNRIKSINPLLLKIALMLEQSNRERVHEKGENKDGSQIGSYSAATKKIKSKRRTVKGRGVAPARSNVSKVILSDTRTLENSYEVAPTQNGYDVGFNNNKGAEPPPSELVGYLEEKFGKNIWGVSKDDKKEIRKLIKKYVSDNQNKT